jgi:hypothetical protein
MEKLRLAIMSKVRNNIARAQATQVKSYNRRHAGVALKVGSKVWKKNMRDASRKEKLKDKWRGPYTITAVTEMGGYYLKDSQSHALKRVVPPQQVKPYLELTDDEADTQPDPEALPSTDATAPSAPKKNNRKKRAKKVIPPSDSEDDFDDEPTQKKKRVTPKIRAMASNVKSNTSATASTVKSNTGANTSATASTVKSNTGATASTVNPDTSLTSSVSNHPLASSTPKRDPTGDSAVDITGLDDTLLETGVKNPFGKMSVDEIPLKTDINTDSDSDCQPQTHLDKPGNDMYFNPLNIDDRAKAALSFGMKLSLKSALKYMGVGKQLHDNEPPRKWEIVAGDGHCFFRSISFLLTGRECFHTTLRQVLMSMIENPITFNKLRQYVPVKFKNGKDYVRQKRMRGTGWATEVELFAVAQLTGFDVVVYSASGHWLRHAASGDSAVSSEFAFYLDNRTGDHYNPITHV